MNKIKLDSRLKSVASLVRKGSVAADVGTDHGYVAVYLLENGICERAIASDLRTGPLENARQTVLLHNLEDKIELILSDGLLNIKENSCTDIVIAGMGGILISEILEKAPWVKNKEINIVAQPMTHAEVLRKWLILNGFRIEKEVSSTDGKRLYVAFNAKYTGEKLKKSEAYYYVGELYKNEDEISKKYINKLLFYLERKHEAQKSAGIEDKENLENLISEIRALIGR